MMITVLSGGTGSIKLIRGLRFLEENITIVVNIGDNITKYGLYITPDIDTIIYGLSNQLDKKKGWGIKNDSFNFLNKMSEFDEETWFNIGDKDLATHLFRTKMLKEGLKLTEITDIIKNKFKIKEIILPASNDHIETKLKTDKGYIHLQEYWVKYKGELEITEIKYDNIQDAAPAPEVIESIISSKYIIIAPGNPFTSIKPILEIPGIKDSLRKTSAKKIIISPIIENRSFSGPAGKIMKELGLETNIYNLSRYYKKYIDAIVIDISDIKHKKRIENSLGIKVFSTDIRMENSKDEKRIAKFVLKSLHKTYE